MGRPSKPDNQKAKNAGFTLYPGEITAIADVAAAKRMKTSSDYVRTLVIQDDHPRARGRIAVPRKIPA